RRRASTAARSSTPRALPSASTPSSARSHERSGKRMNRSAFVQSLREAVGAEHVFSDSAIEPRYLSDWFVAMEQGAPLAVVRPRTTAEVSAVLRACHAQRVPVIPQGGLTGLSGGATPVDGAMLLSLERMNGVEEVDAAAATL